MQRLKVNYRWWHIKWRREHLSVAQVEGRDLGDLQRNTLILQMTGPDSNITEGNCGRRNGKNWSCILQEVSFTAFSFGCNFIEFAAPLKGKFVPVETVLWQRISVNLIKIQPFKAQGINVTAGNISWGLTKCLFVYQLHPIANGRKHGQHCVGRMFESSFLILCSMLINASSAGGTTF